MADRYTKKNAEQCAERLATTLGKKFGKCWIRVDGKNVAQIGCWQYDHNSIYGGGVIEEIMNEGGGIDQPFGSRRLKPDTFCVAVNMAEKAVHIDREKKRKSE
jgi:hypothetical protein